VRNHAALILTHGRPEYARDHTYRALRRQGYTGRILFLLDDEDDTADTYRDLFGADNVITFDKAAVAETFDTMDTSTDRRTVVYARNAAQAAARDMGLDYLIQLDDDFNIFVYRYWDVAGIIRGQVIRNLDPVFEAMFTLLDDTGAAVVAFSQGGDHMGGGGDEPFGGNLRKGYRRKAMNLMFLRTARPVEFLGRINEDVTAYVLHGSRGDLFFTMLNVQLDQTETQKGEGGMSDVYLDAGTYVKSFYTVMAAPSCVTIRSMGRFARRLHHHVSWDRAVPKILGPEHRKPLQETSPQG
jgi:hypothetical protein